jgi:hypothetical protein
VQFEPHQLLEKKPQQKNLADSWCSLKHTSCKKKQTHIDVLADTHTTTTLTTHHLA